MNDQIDPVRAPRGKAKSEFWWASVAGSKTEPVEVTKLDGERVAFTCGCGDPFYLDRPDCPVLLVPVSEYRGNGLTEDGPMIRPLTPKQEAAEERRQRRLISAAQNHSWRGER